MISQRCPSGTSTSKFWKSCSRQYFIVIFDEHPHLRKAEAYFNSSGSISLKKSPIRFFCHFGKTCSNTLQTWLPSMSCLRPIRTCYSLSCPRLDENDGINSLVFSKLFYCSNVWANTSKCNVNKLQAVQNFACRIVSGARKYGHITPIRKELNWLPVANQLYYRSATVALNV